MTKRSEKQRAILAGHWLASQRKRLGWTVEELCERAEIQALDHRFFDPVPRPDEVIELEAGNTSRLPRWLRWAHYAIERAALDKKHVSDWYAERNYHWASHPFDASHPMLFYDEFQMIGFMSSYPDEQRRKIYAFMRAWAGPYEETKRKALVDMLEVIGGFRALAHK